MSLYRVQMRYVTPNRDQVICNWSSTGKNYKTIKDVLQAVQSLRQYECNKIRRLGDVYYRVAFRPVHYYPK